MVVVVVAALLDTHPSKTIGDERAAVYGKLYAMRVAAGRRLLSSTLTVIRTERSAAPPAPWCRIPP